MGPAESLTQVVTDTVAPGFTSHVIHYTYDDVYRLTDAIYTGDITATYKYAYDPVGNMTAYTETLSTGSGQALGTQTTRVMRYFDDANRLQDSFDYDAGTTSYLYDNNGNLTLIIPPDGGNWLHYGYDQRNLMITHTLSVSGTNPQLQAAYAYDGAGSRVQQVDYTGAEPETTTYVNDIVGLTQMLLADDGAEQVYNLFGLDLISQDEGINTRYLLADGLGSVRTEMVDVSVESVTTYDPYGNLLTQTGNSGTTYGYTGEQYDDATGLLYLRARYYNPALRLFMGRDPWGGDMQRPQSMNGWSYVKNDPINLVDLSGMLPSKFPGDKCHAATNKFEYIACVVGEYGIDSDVNKARLYTLSGSSGDPDFDNAMDKIRGSSQCFSGPVPYFGYGYSEGKAYTINHDTSRISSSTWFRSYGQEIVYDFATMERAEFVYTGRYISDSIIGYASLTTSSGIGGFQSWDNIDDDYRGLAEARSEGLSLLGGLIIELPILSQSLGLTWSRSAELNGEGMYTGWSFSVDLIPFLEIDKSASYYTMVGTVSKFRLSNGLVDIPAITQAIRSGSASPWSIGTVFNTSILANDSIPESFGRMSRGNAVDTAIRYGEIYNQMLKEELWGR